jgi:arylsulfatase A-like enzyme
MDLIRFRDAFSPSFATIPSHASMFTGSYYSVHQTSGQNKILNPDLETMAGKLSTNGYQTIGFSNNIHVSPQFDFDRGFDKFVFNKAAYGEPFGGASLQLMRQHADTESAVRQLGEMLSYVRESDNSIPRTTASWLYKKATEAGLVDRGDRGADEALQFLEDNIPSNDGPYFMFFNLMEGHMPFLAPDEHLNRFEPNVERNVWGNYDGLHNNNVEDSERIVTGLRDKYDGCISYLDEIVDRMVAVLREQDALDNTYLFILGDHGEGFGEHGIYGHTGGLYNEIIRVPFLLRPPGGSDGEVIEYPVSAQWIMPTVLSEAGISIPDQCVDQHLLEKPDIPVVFESSGIDVDADNSDLERYYEPMVGGVHENRKLIAGETWKELYEFSDRLEEQPLSENHDIDTVIESEISRYDRTERSSGYSDQDLAADTQEQLRKLGYM